MSWKDKFPKENIYFETSNGILYCADVFDLLTKFPKESIDCVITSPPYYSQRFYGEVANRVWDGDPNCNHEWSSEILVRERGKAGIGNTGNHSKRIPGQEEYKCYGQFCLKCKAWHGQLGLEPDFNMYLEHLWQLFDEIYKILKPTGTCWVNLGDTYTSKSKHTWSFDKKPEIKEKLPPKCLYMIPERFAIGMIDRNWILRNQIVWKKLNAIPQSAKDRFTVDFEKIFFFVKQGRYYFRQQLEPCVSSKPTEKKSKRNKRTVWEIATKPTKFKHFASFCIDIPEICIKAGCPEYVCKKCGSPREHIYERVLKFGETKKLSGKYLNSDNLTHSPGSREKYYTTMRKFKLPKSMQVVFAKWLKSFTKGKEALLNKTFGKDKWLHWIRTDASGQSLPSPKDYYKLKEILNLPNDWDKWLLEEVETLVDNTGNSYKEYGWSEFCRCGNNTWGRGLVLDPFAGIGTTALASEKLGRKWICIEINPEYCEVAKQRIIEFLKQPERKTLL